VELELELELELGNVKGKLSPRVGALIEFGRRDGSTLFG
jgi:hypothetical protein